MKEVDRQLLTLPTAAIAGQAWKDYGQVIVCKDFAEMVKEADRIASEHVQVMTKDTDYFLRNMTNYGALFLGPGLRTLSYNNVPFLPAWHYDFYANKSNNQLEKPAPAPSKIISTPPEALITQAPRFRTTLALLEV